MFPYDPLAHDSAKYIHSLSSVSPSLDDLLEQEREHLRVIEEDLAEKTEALTRVQADLMDEEQRYHELFDFAPDAYLVTDVNGVIREANEAASRLLALQHGFLRGKVLVNFMRDTERHGFRQCLQQLQHTPARVEYNVVLLPRKGPPVSVFCTAASMRGRRTDDIVLHWLIRDVTEQKRLESERDQARDMKEEHARHSLLLQERNRMAQELHDTMAQGFTGIKLQLEVAETLFAQSPDKALEAIHRAREMALDSFADASKVVRALRATQIEKNDLVSALSRLCERMTDGTKVRWKQQGNARLLPDDIEAEIYRVGQEALTNAVRHANAFRITLTLIYHADRLELRVEDDGCGFDVENPGPATGTGLNGMRGRAARLGSMLAIVSRPGEGTRILLTVPYSTTLLPLYIQSHFTPRNSPL